eukprot:2056949-Prymnesium_polylepis.1
MFINTKPPARRLHVRHSTLFYIPAASVAPPPPPLRGARWRCPRPSGPNSMLRPSCGSPN